MLIYLAMLETEEERAFFTRLYEQNRDLMLQKARTILHDDSLGEDATHEAFLRIVSHLSLFQVRPETERQYLCLTFVTNEAKKLRRDWNKGQEPLSLESLPPVFTEKDDQFLRWESAERLERAIAGLEDIYRQIVTFRLVFGFSTIETAELLDVSENVVKVRLHRARAKLMEVLRDDAE